MSPLLIYHIIHSAHADSCAMDRRCSLWVFLRGCPRLILRALRTLRPQDIKHRLQDQSVNHICKHRSFPAQTVTHRTAQSHGWASIGPATISTRSFSAHIWSLHVKKCNVYSRFALIPASCSLLSNSLLNSSFCASENQFFQSPTMPVNQKEMGKTYTRRKYSGQHQGLLNLSASHSPV